MFKRSLITWSSICLLFIAGFFLYLYVSASESKITYQLLVNEHALAKKNRAKEEICPMQQRRQNVTKQILYTHGSDRLQARLASEISDLSYSKQTGEFSEKMSIVTCLMQEKNENMIVNSGEAQYDGKEMSLEGQVSVQHPLGQISARKLTLQATDEGGKKNRFGLLKIDDQVQITLKDGGELHCQHAEIDYGKMQGIFTGNADFPDVAYLHDLKETKGKNLPHPSFEIKSTKMTLDLIKENDSQTSSSRTLVQRIEADQNVRIHYERDHLLLADHAFYQRLPHTPSSRAGILTLVSNGNPPLCKMTNLNGDQLAAKMIQLDTEKRQLWLEHPKGTLYFRNQSPTVQTLEFSALELIWDDLQQNLLLQGQVNVIQNGALRIHTDNQLSISQTLFNGKKSLKSLYSPTNTHIFYKDAQKGIERKIYCPGPFHIDHVKKEMTMQSISPTNQEHDRNSQVYVDDVLGEMYANHVHIKYEVENRQMLPSHMLLEGNVRLINRFDGHVEESGSILHYALADRVEYDPKEKELILISENGNRVLFFDKINNVQMSAPSLKVRRDASTDKDVIRGQGDVRFTFIDKEFDQMKRYFPLGSMEQESNSAKSSK